MTRRKPTLMKLVLLAILLAAAAASFAASSYGTGPVTCKEICITSYKYCGVWVPKSPAQCFAEYTACLRGCGY